MNGILIKKIFLRYHRIHGYKKNDYGVLEVDSSSKLTGFQEKPVTSFNVSMGI